MAVIDTINVGGADYSIQDATARQLAQKAIDRIPTRPNVQALTWNIEPGISYLKPYAKGDYFIWTAYERGSTNRHSDGLMMKTTKAVSAGESIIPSTNCEGLPMLNAINNINVYVGSDGKIHFTNAWGADSVLNFSSSGSNGSYPHTITTTGFTSAFNCFVAMFIPSQVTLTLTSFSVTVNPASGQTNNSPFCTLHRANMADVNMTVNQPITIAAGTNMNIEVGGREDAGGIIEARFTWT